MGTTAGTPPAGASPAPAAGRSRQAELRELARLARVRVGEVDRLRAEHELILAESERRLEESRRLLHRARARGAVTTCPQV